MKRNREEELRAQANSKRSCFRVSYFIRFRKYARIKAKSGYAGVISKADEYRAKAEECEQQAASAHDSQIKAQLRDLAQQWRKLAMTAEDNKQIRHP